MQQNTIKKEPSLKFKTGVIVIGAIGMAWLVCLFHLVARMIEKIEMDSDLIMLGSIFLFLFSLFLLSRTPFIEWVVEKLNVHDLNLSLDYAVVVALIGGFLGGFFGMAASSLIKGNTWLTLLLFIISSLGLILILRLWQRLVKDYKLGRTVNSD
jgi:hypothetical protein